MGRKCIVDILTTEKIQMKTIIQRQACTMSALGCLKILKSVFAHNILDLRPVISI